MNPPVFDRRALLGLSIGALAGTCVGCPGKPPGDAIDQPAAKKPNPLVVLVVDDAPLASAISREWRGRTEEELTVREVTLGDLSRASRLPGDAVVFPSGSLGQLAEHGLIAPLEGEGLEAESFKYRDIFDLVRLKEMRWGGRTVAAPLGSPQLLLCYRADVFEKLNLSVPGDWDAYQQVVERLAADRPTSGDWSVAIEPLAEGWAGQTLLARAACYAMHRDQVSPLFRLGTAEPLIAQPPYVRALEALQKAVKTAGTAATRKTPAEAFAELRAGRCAMTLAWPTAGILEEAASENAEERGKLAFAPLPTSGQVYRFATGTWDSRDAEERGPIPVLSVAGRAAAVSTSSQDAKRAAGFVLWLGSQDVSTQVAAQSAATTLFRHSQVAQSGRWTPQLAAEESRQYAETLATTLSAPRAMPGITLPGREEYLAALDEAVIQALDGKSAAEALAQAAGRWREITEKLGAEAQKAAIGRSLGQSGRGGA